MSKCAVTEAALAAKRFRDACRAAAVADGQPTKAYFIAASTLTQTLLDDDAGDVDDLAAFLRGHFGQLAHNGFKQSDAHKAANACIIAVWASILRRRQ